MSNIVNVFNPPEETKFEDCLSCDIFNSVFLLGTGSYLVSGKAITKNNKLSLQEFNKKNPKWWINSLKGFGGALFLYGIYRSGDTYKSWKESQQKKLSS